MKMYLNKFFLPICLAMLAGHYAFAQSVSGISLNDEADFAAATKQVNQFFRRFNNEEDLNGQRHPANSPKFRANNDARAKFIQVLFDGSNYAIADSLKRRFVNHVTQKEKPQFLDFHHGEWYAEVVTTFSYQGREEELLLFMELEQENLGYKWVIKKVFFKPFSQFTHKPQRPQSDKFLHPKSHEIGFMNLNRVFENPSQIEVYTSKDYRPDQLSFFLAEIKKSTLRFIGVNQVKFHFFQVDNWYFEVSEFNRPGKNAGWLISNLVQVQAADKDLMRRFIFKELN